MSFDFTSTQEVLVTAVYDDDNDNDNNNNDDDDDDDHEEDDTVLELKPRSLHVLSKPSSSEQHPNYLLVKLKHHFLSVATLWSPCTVLSVLRKTAEKDSSSPICCLCDPGQI